MKLHLSENAACEVQETLVGGTTSLAEIIAASESAALRDEWWLTVTPRTVHRIEGITQLAERVGATVHLEAGRDLDARQKDFLEEFLGYQRLRSSPSRRLARRVVEWCSLAGECLSLALRLGAFLKRPVELPEHPRFEAALIIGMYGGEHAGDAAILGGVLRHLHQTYGTEQATVLSRRPERTRWLLAGVSTPIRMSVVPYRAREVGGGLLRSQILVLAGGPIADHPRLLTMHLAAAAAARWHRRPFLIEHVGILPLRRRSSRWLARRCATSAARVSVRSSSSAKHPLLRNIDVKTGRDPAFDYLESRDALELLQGRDRDSVDALLRGTEECLRVGINLKLVHPREAQVDRSKFSFFDGVAEGLVRFARDAERPVSFIYFPMDATQSGRSDLTGAFRLQSLVRGDADLRVWEADADVDPVVYLIRHLHMALTMRFHAAVFALAQGLPIVGIDTWEQGGAKLTELFRDSGLQEDVRTTRTFHADWLVERLRHHSLLLKE